MSLNSFFDTLDTEAQFDAWRSNIRQKLTHLKNTLPIENREELLFVGETLQFLDNLTFQIIWLTVPIVVMKINNI